MAHIAKDSNIVERLFSRAKLIMRDHRKHMSPYHMELLLFLKFNRNLWGIPTIDDIILKKEYVERPGDDRAVDSNEIIY